MTNAPPSRKTHVVRILGTNKNGDVLQDMWVDVERMDRAQTVRSDGSWQGVLRRFRWRDDPDSDEGVVEPRTRDGENVGDGSRDVITVKVCSPDEPDLSDPLEWVPIDSIKHMRSRDADQGVVHTNKELTEARVVAKRRVIHRSTTMDTAAQAAFKDDPTRKMFVVPGDQYDFVSDTDDKEQYVETEVILFLKDLINRKTGNGDDQGSQTKLLNQYLIDQTTDAILDVVGVNGFNPPYRLDPYQNIVNVNLGGVIEVEPLSCVTQEESGATDSKKMMISIWSRVPGGADDPGGGTLLEWGPPPTTYTDDNSDTINLTHSKITFNTDPASSPIGVSVAGNVKSAQYSTCDSTPGVMLGSVGMAVSTLLPFPFNSTPSINLIRFGTVPTAPFGTKDIMVKETSRFFGGVPPIRDYQVGGIFLPSDGPVVPVGLENFEMQTLTGDLITGSFTIPWAVGTLFTIGFFGSGNGGTNTFNGYAQPISSSSSDLGKKSYVAGKWNHTLVIIDMSIPFVTPSDGPASSAPTIQIAQNNVIVSDSTSDIAVELGPGHVTSAANGTGFSTLPPASTSCVPGGNANDGEPTVNDPFEIAINGWEFALPNQIANARQTNKTEYASVMVFMGIAPDIESVLPFFVRPRGSNNNSNSDDDVSVDGIMMVSPQVAIKEFGIPAYELSRGPKPFLKNNAGSAGSLTTSGEDIQRYSPGPPVVSVAE